MNQYKELKLHLGEALDKSGAYGNIERVRQIYDKELKSLNSIDQFLFAQIYLFCTQDIRENFYSDYPPLPEMKDAAIYWKKAKKKYPYLDSKGKEDTSKSRRVRFIVY